MLRQQTRQWLQWLTRGGLALAGLTASADPAWVQPSSSHGRCPAVVPGAMPAPSGYFVKGWEAQMVARAEMSDFIIYQQEWRGCTAVPGPYGSYHLAQIAKRLPSLPFTVVIEPDQSADAVNVARRQMVINYLVAHGVADAPGRVVVGFPQAEGLFGDEAFRIYLRTIVGNQQGGGGMGGGMGGGGGNLGLGGFGGSGGIGGTYGGGLGGFGGR